MLNAVVLNAVAINGMLPLPFVADDCTPIIRRLPGSVPNASPLGSWTLNGRGGVIVTECVEPRGPLFDPLARVEVYLLLIGGQQVPMSSFQATMRKKGKSFVQAVIPGDLNTALENGAVIEVKLGYYYPDSDAYGGLEVIARANLDTVRIDEGATNLSTTISGYGGLTSVQPAHRALQGVQTRSINNGVRRVKCDVDLLLRPDNYADDEDGATFRVGKIQYFVNSASAGMEVFEDG